GLRFSLAGVQLKFSMIRSGGRFSLPAHDSRGDWIVKIGDVEYPGLAENEYTMLSWSSAAGFDVPERFLLEPGDLPAIQKYLPQEGFVLAVRRYDRTVGGPIHQEDFAQMIGSKKKYEGSYDQLGVVVRGLLGEDAFAEFVRRVVLTIAMGGNDAHLKNWSVVYRDERRPELAPLYDQVSTIAWPKLDRQLALKLAGARDFGRIGSDSIRRIAAKAGADPAAAVDAASRTLKGLRESWADVLEGGAMLSDPVEAIRDHWRRVPLLRESGELG
ncbi:MAG: type II toxin-antitoxin system HipA family toxin, partial [Vicinamibacteria bacterium]